MHVLSDEMLKLVKTDAVRNAMEYLLDNKDCGSTIPVTVPKSVVPSGQVEVRLLKA